MLIRMKTQVFKRYHLLIVIALTIIGALTLHHYNASVLAQSGGGYDLTWNTIDGGGITFATGGNYSLGGTIGQPDAGTLSGGSYTLRGGFWGAADTGGNLYLPVIMR